MKKLYPYADCLVALCGLGGALLRQQMLSGGVDEKGLYPASAAWSALLVLTALVLVGIWLLSHKNVPQPKRPAAFQAVGALCAAAGLLHFGISQLSSTLPAMKIAAILALGGGVSHAGDFLLNAVRAKLPEMIFYKGMPCARIELAQLTNDAGIIGAAMLGRAI